MNSRLSSGFFSTTKMELCGRKYAVKLVRASRTTDPIAIQTAVGEDVVGTLGDDLHTVLLLYSPVNRITTLK